MLAQVAQSHPQQLKYAGGNTTTMTNLLRKQVTADTVNLLDVCNLYIVAGKYCQHLKMESQSDIRNPTFG